jgi:hypothetical protein
VCFKKSFTPLFNEELGSYSDALLHVEERVMSF